MAIRTLLVVLSAISASLAVPAELANLEERAPGCTARAYINPSSLKCPGTGARQYLNYDGRCKSYNADTPIYAVDVENFVSTGCKRQTLTAYYNSYSCEVDPRDATSVEKIPANRCTNSVKHHGRPFKSFKVHCDEY